MEILSEGAKGCASVSAGAGFQTHLPFLSQHAVCFEEQSLELWLAVSAVCGGA